MAGSESGFSVTPYGQWHARELELMVKLLGLSPMEAIVAGTHTNAEVLGWGAETGTLEPGRLADILIVEGDPLADISVLGKPERIQAVFKGGIPVPPTEQGRPRRRMPHERGFHVSARILNRTEAP
jgi:imidazolonepropionase-like amidohydrolase